MHEIILHARGNEMIACMVRLGLGGSTLIRWATNTLALGEGIEARLVPIEETMERLIE